MKSLPHLTLLAAAGLVLSGCVSDESSFTNVPGPSGSTTVASSAPAASSTAASSAPQELPSTPPPEELPSGPPPAEQPAETKPAPVSQPAPAQPKPKSTKPAKPTKKPAPAQSFVTTDAALTGKVVTYNAVGRFVVLGFSVGRMAQVNQTMYVYHDGAKSGELRITGPQRDNNIVADVTSGTVQAGDEVRDR